VTVAVAVAALLAGVLIGLTGIGGVLVAPALTEFAAVPVDRAIAASLLGFLIAGIVAAVAHLPGSGLPPVALGILCAAAAIGAAAGATSLELLPAVAVRLFIAVLALASGLHALLSPRASSEGELPSRPTLAALGLAVGYGSAVSGTGGPVMLIPLLLALRTPARAAVALGIAAQLPIVVTATAINAMASRIDFQLGGMLAVLLALGTLGGSAAYRHLSGRATTLSVAVMLVATGVWYGFVTVRGT
jgi:uncharacterized protein